MPVFHGSEAGTLNLQGLSNDMLGPYAVGAPEVATRREQELDMFILGIYP